MAQDPAGFWTIKRRYLEAVSARWRLEVQQRADIAERNMAPSRLTCVKKIIKAYGETGFAYDKARSSSREMSFSKDLSGSLIVVWKFDTYHLNREVGPPFTIEESGEVIQPGPTVGHWFECYESEDTDRELFKFTLNCFLPMHVGPIGNYCYRKFGSEEELLVLMSCLLDCYLITEDLLLREVF